MPLGLGRIGEAIALRPARLPARQFVERGVWLVNSGGLRSPGSGVWEGARRSPFGRLAPSMTGESGWSIEVGCAPRGRVCLSERAGGAAGGGGVWPAEGAEHRRHLGCCRAGIAHELVSEPERLLRVHQRGIVSRHVAPAGLGVRVPGSAVEFDDEAIVHVLDIPIDRAAVPSDTDLPAARGETVSPLHLAKVRQLEERLDPISGVPQYPGEEVAPGEAPQVFQLIQKTLRGRPALPAGVEHQSKCIVGPGSAARDRQHRDFEPDDRRFARAEQPAVEVAATCERDARLPAHPLRVCGISSRITSSAQSPSSPCLRSAVSPPSAASGPYASQAAHSRVSQGTGPVKST